MGTRADFYVGRGEGAEWLGSIAFDGHTVNILGESNERTPLALATSPEAFRAAFAEMTKGRDDVTLPADGWPWPWETSHTTDYAYAFDEGQVWCSCFGHSWHTVEAATDEVEGAAMCSGDKTTVFPNMKDRQCVTYGRRSGILIIGIPREP